MGTLATRTIKAGITYFALVFGAGFVLGSIRVPFLVPRLGERAAELIEMPFMFVVVLVTARFITNRFSLPANALPRLGAGFLALGLLVAAEVLLASLSRIGRLASMSPAGIQSPALSIWQCWRCLR